MKTLICLLFAVNVFANVSPDHISTYYYDPSVTISFENWIGNDLQVKIVSEDNEIIFSDRLNTQKSDGVKYNLRNLSSGKYVISLENDTKRVVETLILFDGKIVEKDEKVYYKPVINKVGDRIKINFLSTTGNAVVKIYNENGTVFHEEFTNAIPLKKFFNISELKSGTYTVSVSDKYVTRSVRITK